MQTTIKMASTDAEREAIFRLRYEIYVEEMQIFGAVADHERRQFIDPHDPTARLMYATVDDDIIGTLRLNVGADAPFSEEFDLTYGLDRFRAAVADAKMVVLTRFMVKKAFRGTPVPYQMTRIAQPCSSQSQSSPRRMGAVMQCTHLFNHTVPTFPPLRRPPLSVLSG